MRKNLLAGAVLALIASATMAADYYIVVPFNKKATAPVSGLSVSLNSLTLPKGVVGVPYAGVDLKSALSVTGDQSFSPANVGWAIDSGTLPAGLSLGADGVISGTPTTAGSENVTVRATYKSANGTQTYELVVLNLSVSLSTAALPNPSPGVAYSFDLNSRLNVSGDSSFDASKVSWSIASGGLPAGLSLSANGVIAGYPQLFSNSGATFSLKADYLGKHTQQSYTVYPADSESVGAMLHFNGVNGSTSFVDEKGISYTSSGAVISTAASKFGGASGLFNGTSLLSSGVSNNFYFPGDFTFETFVRFTDISDTWTTYTPSNQYMLDIGGNGTYFGWRVTHGWSLFKNGAPLLSYVSVPNVNQWYHVAVQRRNGTLQLFLDGQEVASNPFAGVIGAQGLAITLGNFGGGGPYGLKGYLDEFRISPSSARYTGNFTVPTQEYPSR